jgi:uncharacterized membrane protein
LTGPPIEIEPAFEMNRAVATNRFTGALLLSALTALPLTISSTGPAAADFRLCNNTSSRVGIAIGYKDNEGWTTEGWWNLPARTCETVLKGNLVARYYYVYAIDYDRGGEWMGQAYMCTRDKEFTIRGIGDCLARGYDRSGFFEVDTGEQRAWTVQLTESSEQPKQPGPVSSNPPGAVPPAIGTPAIALPPGRGGSPTTPPAGVRTQ